MGSLSPYVRAQVDTSLIIKGKRKRSAPGSAQAQSLGRSKRDAPPKKRNKVTRTSNRSKARQVSDSEEKDPDSDSENEKPKTKKVAKKAVRKTAESDSEEEKEETPRPKPTRSRTTMVKGFNPVVQPKTSGRAVHTKTVIVKSTASKSDDESEEEQEDDEDEEEKDDEEVEEEEKEEKETDTYKQSPASDDEEEEEEEEEESSEDDDSDSERKASFLKKKRLGKALTTSSPSKKKPVLHAGRAVKRVNQMSDIVPLRRVNSAANDEEQTPYALARERLHVSAVPESLPCREEEFVSIMGYVESAIQEGTGTCVYISGVPGTGKTATVLEVIRHLQQKADDEELPEFDFVEINGMKLTDPNQAYSILWECVDDSKQKKRYTPNHSLHLLETQFINNTQNQRTIVVLMDELDLLVTKKQTVMYNFFDWPSRPLSKLIVIAVANTMDLPERLMSNKIASRMGLTRINFQPYNYNQLYQIVQSRLEGINAFGKEAVEFAARKVSAVSGDARRALDICRRAVEVVEDRLNNPTTASAKLVTIGVVDEAIKEMFTSPAVSFVKSCSLHQKVFLVSCMQRVRAIGLAEIEFGDVAHNHVQTCKWHNIEPPNTSDLMRVCESLGQSRALVMESGSMDIHMRLSLNLVEEDILMACKTDKFVSMLLQKLMSIE